MLMYIIYIGIIMLIPMWASHNVKSTFNKYARVRSTSGLTGKEVAEQMLRDHGITDVRVEQGQGFLSDHYDPRAKVVRLSPHNYNKPSVSGTAVAAHEIGHAIQHAEGYSFLNFRTALFPVASLGSQASYLFIMAGIFLTYMNNTMGSFGATLLWIGIGLMSLGVLFQIITLPVEFNASHRAMQYIKSHKIVNEKEYSHANKVLKAAAMTYVASAAVAVAELLRLILIAKSQD
ncbi:zinc metallopeptidase [Abyssicoccus albus]|uniref:Uncharacterized protein n=1 Tax=Abyssicoccus albus TaxID=1817405 RepID=A0A1Q1G1C0_9BACL|nr:zinc metallopeptidase [Abyssicoccus albus]AQL56163.1 zinc metallopeptidase [Abyssicoccus albus]RPF58017.1 hypothetical protein EDD62_0655 [Abyssicoccus albus]